MTTTRVKARYVIGYDGESHRTLKDAEVVYRGDSIVFVGRGYEGQVDQEIDGGNAILGPGFIDLNALADLDTTVLAFDNQPDWAKGRTWPEDYLKSGPVEMYSDDEQTFKMKYAFVQLIRNGITTALPITSMFYREWAETYDEFVALGRQRRRSRHPRLSRPLLHDRRHHHSRRRQFLPPIGTRNAA